MTGGVATANEDLSPGRFSPSGVHPHPLELAHEIVLFSCVNYSSVCKCFGGNKKSAPHTRAWRCPGWLHFKTERPYLFSQNSYLGIRKIYQWELRLSHFFVLCSFITLIFGTSQPSLFLRHSLPYCQRVLFSLWVTRGCFHDCPLSLLSSCNTSVAPFALRHV